MPADAFIPLPADDLSQTITDARAERLALELVDLLNRAMAAGVHFTGQYGDGEPQHYTAEWRGEDNFWQTRKITLGSSSNWEVRGG